MQIAKLASPEAEASYLMHEIQLALEQGARMMGLHQKMGGKLVPNKTPRIDYDFGMEGFYVIRGDKQ